MGLCIHHVKGMLLLPGHREPHQDPENQEKGEIHPDPWWKPEGICCKALTRRLNWKLQKANDPKHTAKVDKKSLKENDIRVQEWRSQSPDLNPTENLWKDLNARMMARKPTSLTQPESIAKEEWTKLPQEMCRKIVGTFRNRTRAIINNQKYAIDYYTKTMDKDMNDFEHDCFKDLWTTYSWNWIFL